MFGPHDRAPRGAWRLPAARVATAFLILILTGSGVPAQAWAQAAEELSATAAAVQAAEEAAPASDATASKADDVADEPAAGEGEDEPKAEESGAEDASAGKAAATAESSSASKPAAKSAKAASKSAATRTAADPASTLAAAVEALAADGFSGYYPNPKYGQDKNLNALIEARLAKLGYEGITSRVVSATFSGTDPAARGGIDTGSGEGNGDVTYFFLAPEDKTVSTQYSTLRQFGVVYELSLDGVTATYEPSRKSTLAWDEGRVSTYLEQAAERAAVPEQLVAGNLPEDVASLELPAQVDTAAGDKCVEVKWTSSNTAAAKVTEGWDSSWTKQVTTLKLTHQATPATVELTATYTMFVAGYGAAPEGVSVTKTYTVEVAAKSGATESQIKRQLKKYLAKVTAKDFQTGEAVDASAVAADMRLSRPRDLGVDGKYYKLAYATSDESVIAIDGYRAAVTQSLEGEGARSATITASLTYDGVTETRELPAYTMATVTDAQIEEAVAFMAKVKEAYGEHLLGANASADAVMGDLTAFQGAAPAADGSIAWAQTASDVAWGSIVPVDLPGYDPMSGTAWRAFRSSNEAVVASESLRVTRPDYDKQVTVDSSLTYRAYERLALAHPENAQLASLIAQPVSATFTVKGEKGAQDPEAAKSITVTARVVGVSEAAEDGSRSYETWAPLTEFTFTKGEGLSAWDVLCRLMKSAGLTYSTEGGEPYSVTTADGKRTLAMEGTGGVWSYWSFLVDGQYASTYASGHVAADGETYELRYEVGSVNVAPEGSVTVDPDAERPDWDASWPGFTTSTGATSAATPTGATELKWSLDLAENGAYAGLSDPILVGGYLYAASAGKLLKIDPATGEVLGSCALAASIDSVARMVYAEGVIVVPLHGGRLQAVTPDALATVWVTAALPTYTSRGGKEVEQQSLGTLTVRDGYVYAATTDGVGTLGYLYCVNLANGAVRWSRADTAGYYWSGAVSVGDYLVVGGDDGTVFAFDPATGEQAGAGLKLAGKVRSTLVSDGTYVYAVDYKGTLYKLSVGEDGGISRVASVTFGSFSTSTPALVGGKVYVTGKSATHGSGPYMKAAALFVIDAASMAVEREVWQDAEGATLPTMPAQSSPLVSVQGGETYVYFTVNTTPGGVYRYHVGDAGAELAFEPDADHAQYCLSSVVAGPDGTLYYTNDSKTIFAVGAYRVRTTTVSFAANGGSETASQEVAVGAVAARPDDPTREGYSFTGWYADAALTTPWDFADPVNASLTLYAGWKKDASGEDKPSEPSEPSKPTKPTTPSKPSKPSKPTTPAKPGSGSGSGSGASGTVAPSKRPVSATTADAAKDVTDDKVAANTSDEKAPTTDAAADDGDDFTVASNDASEDDTKGEGSSEKVAEQAPGLGFALVGVGVVGLIVAIVLLARLKRRD